MIRYRLCSAYSQIVRCSDFRAAYEQRDTGLNIGDGRYRGDGLGAGENGDELGGGYEAVDGGGLGCGFGEGFGSYHGDEMDTGPFGNNS